MDENKPGVPPLASCPICGLHYRDPEAARKCQAWCSAHDSCNLELTKSSVERENWRKRA